MSESPRIDARKVELAGLGGGDAPPLDALTDREREVAGLVATA